MKKILKKETKMCDLEVTRRERASIEENPPGEKKIQN